MLVLRVYLREVAALRQAPLPRRPPAQGRLQGPGGRGRVGEDEEEAGAGLVAPVIQPPHPVPVLPGGRAAPQFT